MYITPVPWLAPMSTSAIFIPAQVTGTVPDHNLVCFGSWGGWGGLRGGESRGTTAVRRWGVRQDDRSRQEID